LAGYPKLREVEYIEFFEFCYPDRILSFDPAVRTFLQQRLGLLFFKLTSVPKNPGNALKRADAKKSKKVGKAKEEVKRVDPEDYLNRWKDLPSTKTTIYLHTASIIESTKTGEKVIPTLLRASVPIRVYKNNRWEDLQPPKDEPFRYYIQAQIHNRLYKITRPYGFFIAEFVPKKSDRSRIEDSFYIADVQTDKQRKDRRKEKRGMLCSGLKPVDRYRILYNLKGLQLTERKDKVRDQQPGFISLRKMQNKYKEYSVEMLDWSLTFYNFIRLKGSTPEEICREIFDILKERGLLVYIF